MDLDRKRPLGNPKALKVLGQTIRKLRQQKGISQEALADEAGVESILPSY